MRRIERIRLFDPGRLLGFADRLEVGRAMALTSDLKKPIPNISPSPS